MKTFFVVFVGAVLAASAFGSACSITAGSNNMIAGLSNGLSATPTGDTYDPCNIGGGDDVLQNISYNLVTGGIGFVGPLTINMTAASAGPPASIEFDPVGLGPNGDVQLEFQVVGTSISSVTLQFNAALGSSGNITEVVCTVFAAGGNCPTGDELTSISVTAASPATEMSTADFAPQSEIWVFKDISAGSSPFSEITQQFGTAPEPMTVSLMGVGLVAIGLLGRKKVRR